MEPQGVDVPALLRRTFPLWVAWMLYAAPALWAVQLFRTVTATPNMPFSDTTVYDENGIVISGGPGAAEPIGWLARFGVSLVLMFGSPSPAPPDLPMLGVVAAVLVTAVWTVRGRSFHLRSVAAVGAVFSVVLAVVGLLVVASRDASYEAVKPMLGPEGFGLFDGQFAVWGLVAIFGAILTWAFVRLGFGPLPTVPVPDSPVPDSPVLPELHVTAGAAPGPDNGEDAEPAAPGWDTGPELAPDFLAPEAVSSLYARPVGGPSSAGGSAEAARAEEVLEDPLAVYRRPSGPDS